MTKNDHIKKLKTVDYLMMLAFVLAIFLALAGAVISSGFFNFR